VSNCPDRKRGFTMSESLAVVALAAALLTPTGRLFVDATREVARSARLARQAQTSAVLAARWRLSLRDSRPETWRVEENAFVCEGARIEAAEGRLLFRRGDACVPVALPPGMDAAFAIERPEGLADCAVLSLRPRDTGRPDPGGRIRIVACGREDDR